MLSMRVIPGLNLRNYFLQKPLILCNSNNFFNQSHKMLEKYNVVNCSAAVSRGEYDLQEGFGWTNGVTLAILDLFS